MDYTTTNNGNTCKISMRGKFTFADHMSFKQIFNLLNDKGIANIEVDIKDVEFIDSAALGLMLLLLDESKKHSKKLVVSHPQGQVKKMFDISRFYDVFTIID